MKPVYSNLNSLKEMFNLEEAEEDLVEQTEEGAEKNIRWNWKRSRRRKAEARLLNFRVCDSGLNTTLFIKIRIGLNQPNQDNVFFISNTWGTQRHSAICYSCQRRKRNDKEVLYLSVTFHLRDNVCYLVNLSVWSFPGYCSLLVCVSCFYISFCFILIRQTQESKF